MGEGLDGSCYGVSLHVSGGLISRVAGPLRDYE